MGVTGFTWIFCAGLATLGAAEPTSCHPLRPTFACAAGTRTGHRHAVPFLVCSSRGVSLGRRMRPTTGCIVAALDGGQIYLSGEQFTSERSDFRPGSLGRMWDVKRSYDWRLMRDF